MLVNGTTSKISWNSTSTHQEFRNAITSGYETVIFWVHGYWHHNELFFTEWKTIKPGAFFYVITSCYNGEWHVPDYISGWHIFGEGYGLCVVQSNTHVQERFDAIARAFNGSFVGEQMKSDIYVKIFGDPLFPLRFYPIRIHTKYRNSSIQIDGATLTTDDKGEIDVYLSNYGSHKIEMPQKECWNVRFYTHLGSTMLSITPTLVVNITEGTRAVFDGWYREGALFSKESEISLEVKEPITFISLEEAVWYIEQFVTATTSMGRISGIGWYKFGENATLSITPTRLERDFFAIYVFEGWKVNGTLVSTSPSYSFAVRESMFLTASWKTEMNPTSICVTIGIILLVIVTVVLLKRKKQSR